MDECKALPSETPDFMATSGFLSMCSEDAIFLAPTVRWRFFGSVAMNWFTTASAVKPAVGQRPLLLKDFQELRFDADWGGTFRQSWHIATKVDHVGELEQPLRRITFSAGAGIHNAIVQLCPPANLCKTEHFTNEAPNPGTNRDSVGFGQK